MPLLGKAFPRGNVFALYFHPEGLASTGIANFTRNIAEALGRLHPEFVTARESTSRLTETWS